MEFYWYISKRHDISRPDFEHLPIYSILILNTSLDIPINHVYFNNSYEVIYSMNTSHKVMYLEIEESKDFCHLLKWEKIFQNYDKISCYMFR